MLFSDKLNYVGDVLKIKIVKYVVNSKLSIFNSLILKSVFTVNGLYKFQIDRHGLNVWKSKLKRSRSTTPVSFLGLAVPNLLDGEREILNIVEKNPSISVRRMSYKVDVSPSIV